MNVIFGSTDRLDFDPVVLANAGDIRPEFWLKFFWQQLAAVLRAENQMDRVLRVGMRHVSRLQRLCVYISRFPSAVG
jgi:hypothetical protein